jgi:hypothetical protein
MTRIELKGNKFTIESLVLADGSCPAGVFLDGLSKEDRQKIGLLLKWFADHGEIRNKEKFKRLEASDHIFAFKSFQIRIACFFCPGRRLILAYGIVKKSDAWKRQDIRRAEDYRNWFVNRGCT